MAAIPAPAKRVFISYSQHDPQDPGHAAKVRELALALADDGGLEVELDQFHQNETLDWPLWCQQCLEPEGSDYVLMVCTAEYLRRVKNQVPADVGRGVWWEGGLIAKQVYREKDNRRFVPVLFGEEPETSIPRSVEGWTWFRLRGFGLASGDDGYRNLYRLLTGQPAVPKPEPRPITPLPPETTPRRSGLQPATETQKAPTPPNNLPQHTLGHLFKGRDELLTDLRETFRHHPRQAIHGLGGIGKTCAAIEYAWRYAGDYRALLFLRTEDEPSLIRSLAGLCPLFGLAEGVIDERQRAQTALAWLADHPGWLLIVDNVDEEAAARAVEDWLGGLAGGHCLLTGRVKEWPADVQARLVDVLSREAAAEFLRERSAGGRHALPDDPALALELADELGGLALALEQAAAFIRRHSLSFADYLKRWRAQDQKTRNWHDGRLMRYPRPLATTWQTSVDTLATPARRLLDLLAWLGGEPIPRFLLDYAYAPENLPEPFFEEAGFPAQVLAELCGEVADVEDACAELAAVSLLTPVTDSPFPSLGKLHKLLALITRERQDAAEQVENLRAGLALVNAVAVVGSEDVRTWPVWGPLEVPLLHLLAAAEAQAMREPTARLLTDLALLLKTKALYDRAEPLYQRSLALLEQSETPDETEIAICLNNLAQLLQDTYRLAEAEPLMRRAWAIDEARFGPQHPNVARDLNNLAQLLQATGRLTEAEPLMCRALAIDEASFGPQHPNVAIDLNTLAALLRETGRLTEAEPLMRRALEIDEASLGLRHPKVAIHLNNLAQLLKATGRLTEAEPLMRRALEIDEASLGLRHPKVAIRLNNLAQLLRATHRLVEAEPLMRRALEIDEASFGPRHPNVAIDLNNLAQLLRATNRLAEAEPLMRRHLVIFLSCTRQNGHPHPHLRAAFDNYLGLLQGLPLDETALASRLAALGPEAGYTAADFAALIETL